jgi:molybdopterin/thiamine biosynthesis adenylyltransferase
MSTTSNFADSRYNRQLMMPEWGDARQQKLTDSRVCVIGSGGVKTTFLTALAAAGVGTIRIVEFDAIELSNLNRQTLFTTADIGKPKGQVAQARLQALNPDIDIEWINEKVTPETIDRLLSGFDIIVEGGDSPSGRNLVNEYCLKTQLPYVHASAQFNYGYCFTVVPAWKTACFACYFPTDHTRVVSTGAVPVNVLATQISGSLGANEVIKYLVGYHDTLMVNRKMRFSSLFLSEEFGVEKQARRKRCPVCAPIYASYSTDAAK